MLDLHLCYLKSYSSACPWCHFNHAVREGPHLGTVFTSVILVLVLGDGARVAMGENVLHVTMINLVGGFNHLEKYEFVNGNDYPIYYGK